MIFEIAIGNNTPHGDINHIRKSASSKNQFALKQLQNWISLYVKNSEIYQRGHYIITKNVNRFALSTLKGELLETDTERKVETERERQQHINSETSKLSLVDLDKDHDTPRLHD